MIPKCPQCGNGKRVTSTNEVEVDGFDNEYIVFKCQCGCKFTNKSD
jgi:lysyl-tRNA synthetase class I